METFESALKAKNLNSSIVTVGNFDGLHVGHRALLNQLKTEAATNHCPTVVMTFDPHPVQVLYPDRKLHKIFDRDDQSRELEKLGIDILIIQSFNRELSQLKAEEFLKTYIFKPFSPRMLVVGYDFSFGANRSGGISQLIEFSKLWNFELMVIPPFKLDGQVVSSSRIRQSVLEGNVLLARDLLARPFYLKGVVAKGDQRGRTIGFPTANLYHMSELIPAKGVYATRTWLDDKMHESITNVGLHPTFQSAESIKVETHLFNFDQDIYGKSLKVEFMDRLRDEMKFNSVDQLQEQIKKDILKAKAVHKYLPTT